MLIKLLNLILLILSLRSGLPRNCLQVGRLKIRVRRKGKLRSRKTRCPLKNEPKYKIDNIHLKQMHEIGGSALRGGSFKESGHVHFRKCSCRCGRKCCCVEEDDDDVAESPVETSALKPSSGFWIRTSKITFFFLIWVLFTTILIMKSEKASTMRQIAIPEGEYKSYWIREQPERKLVEMNIRGPFLPDAYRNLSDKTLSVWAELVSLKPQIYPAINFSAFDSSFEASVRNISEVWKIPIVSKDMVDFVPDLSITKVFSWDESYWVNHFTSLRIQMKTNLDYSFPLSIDVNTEPIDTTVGIIYAAVVLMGLYVVIITEIVPRTLAAICASTMSVAILASMNERPTMAELISWIDMETLLLLFSMMMIVGVLSETGIFDHISLIAFRVSGGKPLLLAALLCYITSAMSVILDNVTTVLLMTPCTIRLCNLVSVNPIPILMATVIFSNIGGAITPVGDPPNVMIANNVHFIKGGVNFFTFSLHMGIGIIFVMLTTSMYLYSKFKDISQLQYNESTEIIDLSRQIDVWDRLAASLSSYSSDEETVRTSLQKKVQLLRKFLKKKRLTTNGRLNPLTSSEANLQELKTRKISVPLLLKSSVALLFTVVMFCLHSVADFNLSLGWIALLGAILLLILADNEPIDGVLGRVEWGTLLFFASLFILMEATARLGFIRWIGTQTENVILTVDESSRLTVAILLILWVSALASAFVDNIPLTTMMIRIIEKLNIELGLPLQPLVWSLAFGACLGGNGTLIGASANVVCAGVAEQHGYRFTFLEFFKVGFPVMLVNVSVTSVYLIMCHVWVEWH